MVKLTRRGPILFTLSSGRTCVIPSFGRNPAARRVRMSGRLRNRRFQSVSHSSVPPLIIVLRLSRTPLCSSSLSSLTGHVTFKLVSTLFGRSVRFLLAFGVTIGMRRYGRVWRRRRIRRPILRFRVETRRRTRALLFAVTLITVLR